MLLSNHSFPINASWNIGLSNAAPLGSRSHLEPVEPINQLHTSVRPIDAFYILDSMIFSTENLRFILPFSVEHIINKPIYFLFYFRMLWVISRSCVRSSVNDGLSGQNDTKNASRRVASANAKQPVIWPAPLPGCHCTDPERPAFVPACHRK